MELPGLKYGLAKEIRLGNLESQRDWGFAGEYVEVMWKMLQQKTPQDYVIGTGKSHSVRQFAEMAFNFVGLNYQDYVVQDQRFIRPSEVDRLIADPSKAHKELDWTPAWA